MSKENIKSALESIRKANEDKEEFLDFTSFILSEGATENLTLGNFTLDYISIKISRGKHTNYQANPLQFDPLMVKPSEINREIIEAPDGYQGDFARYIFYIQDKNTTSPVNDEYLESDEIGVEISIKSDKSRKFEEYLYARIASDTIRLYITRTHTGINSTTGTIITDDGHVSGYTVELPRGTDSQCKTICTDNKKPFDCHCIAEGVYSFEINTTVYDAGSTKNHSLRIISTVPDGRTGVLVHGGQDDANGWSQGCILPMPNEPKIDLHYDDRHSKGRNNTVLQSIDFTKELLNWVRLREAEIKKRNNDIENVVKQIIITKTF